MGRVSYKGFDLPDGNAVPDVPADLTKVVDGVMSIGQQRNTLIFSGGVNGGASTTGAIMLDTLPVAGLPVAYRALWSVHVAVQGAFWNLRWQDHTGASLRSDQTNNFAAAQYSSQAMNHVTADYAANAQCGLRLVYWVASASVNMVVTAQLDMMAR